MVFNKLYGYIKGKDRKKLEINKQTPFYRRFDSFLKTLNKTDNFPVKEIEIVKSWVYRTINPSTSVKIKSKQFNKNKIKIALNKFEKMPIISFVTAIAKEIPNEEIIAIILMSITKIYEIKTSEELTDLLETINVSNFIVFLIFFAFVMVYIEHLHPDRFTYQELRIFGYIGKYQSKEFFSPTTIEKHFRSNIRLAAIGKALQKFEANGFIEKIPDDLKVRFDLRKTLYQLSDTGKVFYKAISNELGLYFT